jgi:hypothetical protein
MIRYIGAYSIGITFPGKFCCPIKKKKKLHHDFVASMHSDFFCGQISYQEE